MNGCRFAIECHRVGVGLLAILVQELNAWIVWLQL